MPDGALYFEQCYWPYLEHDDFDRLPEALAENMWCGVRSPPGPLVAGLDGQRLLAEGAKALRARTDRAIVGLFGGNLLETGQFLYRNDNFLMLLAADPDRAGEFLERLVEIHLANAFIVRTANAQATANWARITAGTWYTMSRAHHENGAN